jgi:hypothetical protein
MTHNIPDPRIIDEPQFTFTWGVRVIGEPFEWLQAQFADREDEFLYVYQADFRLTTDGQPTVTLHRYDWRQDKDGKPYRFAARVLDDNGNLVSGAARQLPVTYALKEFPPEQYRKDIA